MDEFMNQQRKPRAEFARDLYRTLSAGEASPRRRAAPQLKFGVAVAAVVVSGLLLLSVPQVGSAAQSFLNLFRVKRITAIAVDPTRLQALQNSNLDLQAMFADSVEVLKKPAEPKVVASAAEASALAGIPVRAPANLGEGVTLSEIRVSGAGTARITADTGKAEALLQALGVTDVQLPASLNGAKVTIDTPAAVAATYRSSRGTITLMQSRSPEIDLPAGVSLAQLGEIGLRAVGMSADDARRFAQTIDWNTTLLVPIPTNAASFREVDVRGVKGLLVTTTGRPAASAPAAQRAASAGPLLLWSEGDVVYALSGAGLSPTDIITLAEAN